MRHHVIRRVRASLLASALVLTACGDDDATSTNDTTTTTIEPDGDGEPEAPAERPDEVADEGQVIDVSVSGGAVTGGGRHEIELGSTVTIRVTSDTADHVHLHGYDILADVAAGETAALTFDATIPGVFEVELEDARLLLAELQIS